MDLAKPIVATGLPEQPASLKAAEVVR